MIRETSARPLYRTTPDVLHVEGMDLAGKSMVTAGLAELYPAATIRHNALVEGNAVYHLADELRRRACTSADVLGYLYVAAVHFDLDHVTEPNGLIIQDSTLLLRSLAFQSVAGNKRIVRALEATIDRHPRFTKSVVLTASIDVRLERLEERLRNASHEIAADDLEVKYDPERFLDRERSLVTYATTIFGSTVIDTSEMARSDVIRAVANVPTLADPKVQAAIAGERD